MSPTTRGRTGDRSTRGRHGARSLPALLILVSLTLMLLDTAQDDGPVQALRDRVAVVLRPLLVGGSPASDGRLTALGVENLALRAENAELRAARALDAALGSFEGYEVLPARVLAYGRTPPSAHTLAIDAGRRDGVREDAAVLAPQGLVGRVIDVASETATVLLACDPRAVVGVRRRSGRELGLGQGRGCAGTTPLAVRMLDGAAGLAPGDELVTWGSPDGVRYPPGVPVGTVTTVGTASEAGHPPGLPAETAGARTAADLTALEWVAVVRAAGHARTGER